MSSQDRAWGCTGDRPQEGWGARGSVTGPVPGPSAFERDALVREELLRPQLSRDQRDISSAHIVPGERVCGPGRREGPAALRGKPRGSVRA